MKIEIGKRYITRNGQVTSPVEKNTGGIYNEVFPFTVKIRHERYSYRNDGRFFKPNYDHYMDLVEEYVDEVEQEGIRLLSEELEELSKSNHVPEIDEGEWESDFIKTARGQKDIEGGVDPVPVEQGGEEKDFDDEESETEEELDSDFMKIAKNAARLLEYKNKKYGNSALNPINVFNGKSAVGQRADDKISRIQNNPTLQKNDIVDLLGYLILIIKENKWESFDEFMD